MLAAGEWKLGGIVAGGFAGGLVVFGGIARVALWVAVRFVRSERVGAGVGGRYALASLERRSGASALQITALGIGLMCLLLIAMTRSDLIAGWRQSTPPGCAESVFHRYPARPARWRNRLPQPARPDRRPCRPWCAVA